MLRSACSTSAQRAAQHLVGVASQASCPLLFVVGWALLVLSCCMAAPIRAEAQALRARLMDGAFVSPETWGLAVLSTPDGVLAGLEARSLCERGRFAVLDAVELQVIAAVIGDGLEDEIGGKLVEWLEGLVVCEW